MGVLSQVLCGGWRCVIEGEVDLNAPTARESSAQCTNLCDGSVAHRNAVADYVPYGLLPVKGQELTALRAVVSFVRHSRDRNGNRECRGERKPLENDKHMIRTNTGLPHGSALDTNPRTSSPRLNTNACAPREDAW